VYRRRRGTKERVEERVEERARRQQLPDGTAQEQLDQRKQRVQGNSRSRRSEWRSGWQNFIRQQEDGNRVRMPRLRRIMCLLLPCIGTPLASCIPGSWSRCFR